MKTEEGWNCRIDETSTSTGEAEVVAAMLPSLLKNTIGTPTSAGVVGECLWKWYDDSKAWLCSPGVPKCRWCGCRSAKWWSNTGPESGAIIAAMATRARSARRPLIVDLCLISLLEL